MPDSRWKLVSIRTLREEGDVAQKLGELIDKISIHALREEATVGNDAQAQDIEEMLRRHDEELLDEIDERERQRQDDERRRNYD